MWTEEGVEKRRTEFKAAIFNDLNVVLQLEGSDPLLRGGGQ